MEWGFVDLKFYFGEVRFYFSFVLLLVGLGVVLFVPYYMGWDYNLSYFIVVFLVFFFRMFFLMLSGGVLVYVLGWDVLGIRRFFLVFYYGNWDSNVGAMNTVLVGRVGDFLVYIFFAGFFFSGLGVFVFVFVSSLVAFYLALAASTKRALFPFRSWLPKAIRAPTPVRALVHRRTLVMAGLVLVLGFVDLWFMKGMEFYFFVFGLLTMVFSRFCALVEEDMKKIVALRTMSQIGFCVMVLGMGMYFVCLLHLVSHALFKSCLFMQVGVFIHRFFSQQDSRGYLNLGGSLFFVQLQMVVTLFCLCGLLFTRGAVTKDVVLEFFFFNGWFWVMGLLFFVGVFLTFVYSYRLFLSLFRAFNCGLVFLHGRLMMWLFRCFLVFFSVVGLWWLMLNMVVVPVIYLYFDFFVPLVFLCVFFVVVGVVFVFFFIELKYKFLTDLVAKHSSFMLLILKFFDVVVGFFVRVFLGLLRFLGLLNVFFFKNFGINVVVVIFFFLVFIL